MATVKLQIPAIVTADGKWAANGSHSLVDDPDWGLGLRPSTSVTRPSRMKELAVPELFTIDEIEDYLREEVRIAGGAKKWCKKHNVNMDHALHMVANGTAASLPRILDALRLEKVSRYRSVIDR